MSGKDNEIVAGGVKLRKNKDKVEVEFLELYAEVRLIRVSDGVDVIVKRSDGEVTGFRLEAERVTVAGDEACGCYKLLREIANKLDAILDELGIAGGGE